MQENSATAIRYLSTLSPNEISRLAALGQQRSSASTNASIDIRSKIASSGALTSLVGLLRASSEIAVDEASVALRNLASLEENRQKILQEGAMPPLVALLSSFTVRTLFTLSVAFLFIFYLFFKFFLCVCSSIPIVRFMLRDVVCISSSLLLNAGVCSPVSKSMR